MFDETGPCIFSFPYVIISFAYHRSFIHQMYQLVHAATNRDENNKGVMWDINACTHIYLIINIFISYYYSL